MTGQLGLVQNQGRLSVCRYDSWPETLTKRQSSQQTGPL